MSNQSITISQSKRINHFSNLIINNNNTNHISHNANSIVITTSNDNLPSVDTDTGVNEHSLDISNIRKKIDNKLNESSMSNNFTRNEVSSTNQQHTSINKSQPAKISPTICVIPTDPSKDEETLTERKDLTTYTFNKKHSKCKGTCDRTCIIRLLCICVISFSLFVFLKWKLRS